MSYLILKKRALDGPLLEYANFADGSFINLIKMNRPYKTGHCYTVYETTRSAFCSNGIFKDHESAKRKFDLMVRNGSYQSQLLERGETSHAVIK